MRYIIFLLLLQWADSLRILSVLPSTTRSHYLPGRRIILELVRKGHSVVSISPFEEKLNENFTWIPVEVDSMFNAVPNLKEEIGQDYTFFGYMQYVWRTINTYTEYITKQPKLSTFMKTDNSHFDLIFMHDFFQPIFYVFSHKYNAPIALISTFGHSQYNKQYIGKHFDGNQVPHEFSQLAYPLTLLDKIRNVIYTYFDFYGRKLLVHGHQNGLIENVFSLSNAPHLEELEREVALVLVNTHFSISIERATLPNIVEIGGVHIEDAKPLSKELQEILDNAEHGAILFSLGSILDLGSQKEQLATDVLKVLGSLEQRVLMKWNSKRNISEYTNLYAYSWLPQNDILAHPNLRLFISHGGLLSNQEAVHYKVPIICVPFQASQPMVCQRSAQLGYAVHLPKDKMDVTNFNASIHRILTDSAFSDNVEKVSNKFRDRLTTPVDTAVYWLEYCAKHKMIVFKSIDSCYWKWMSLVCLIFLFVTARYVSKGKAVKFKVN